MTKRVIIDTDPGVDDALAILLALDAPELEVLGITTVAGNVSLDNTTNNALNLLHYFGQEIPVYRGMPQPLQKKLTFDGLIHGDNGLGGVTIPSSPRREEALAAPDYLIEMGKQSRGEITLITLGPLTNVAVAIEKDPEAMKGYQEIISMGGAVHMGNVTPVAEFNFWGDPHAAKIVFDFPIPITMIGLNVTHQVVLSQNDLRLMREIGGEKGQLMDRIHDAYVGAYWKNIGVIGCVPHDSIAVAYAIDPSLIETITATVDVSLEGITIGQTVVDDRNVWGKEPNAHVGLQIDGASFKERLFHTLFPEQKALYEAYIQNMAGR
jgi:inosine-uridine nucleoside N-ribohydrolase